jgi:hypothetical protein
MRHYLEEIKIRDKHIAVLTDSVRNHEVENKHLIEIIYAKEKEIDVAQKHLNTVIINLRKDNELLVKRLKALQRDYDYMVNQGHKQR